MEDWQGKVIDDIVVFHAFFKGHYLSIIGFIFHRKGFPERGNLHIISFF